MDSRLAYVIGAVEDRDFVPADELATGLDVSRRTVWTYVARVNEILHPHAQVEMVRGKGYRLQIWDAQGYHAVVRRESRVRGSIPQTPSGRVEYLLNDLLNRTDWVTVETLSSVLYVSRATITGDLKAVETVLGKFGLSLERRPHRGVRAEGDEFHRRICLANMALGKNASVHFADWAGMRETIARVAECVDRVLAERTIQINSMAYQNLLVHIAVAVARMSDSHEIPMPANQLTQIQESDAYPAAACIAQFVGEEFGVSFPDEEVAYIAIHLAGKRSLYDGIDDGGKAIPDVVWNLAGAMIERVNDEYSFDFRDDLELRVNLARHIAPLAVRLTYGMQMKNPLIADIKTRFPLAYAMACEASTVLADSYRQSLSDDEIGYIALAFALALDHKKSGEVAKRRVLIVCASGAGSARLLEHRYRKTFASTIEEVETCDVQGLASIDIERFDCVFTTVPLGRELKAPVFEVSAFLDEAEIPRIKSVLESNRIPSESDGFFCPELFFPHFACETRGEVLSFLSEAVKKHFGLDEDVLSLVMEREALATTAFGNRVAMPHPSRPVAPKSVVATAVLDRPIEWGGSQVQVVFLICIKPKDKTLKPLYRALADFMGSEDDVTMLISQQRLDTLLELLN